MSPWLAGLAGFVVVLSLFVEVQDYLHEEREGPLWLAIWQEWRSPKI